jgi:hypothetical protein
MTDEEKGLMLALLHELSFLKGRVAALQHFCEDLMLERGEDKEETARKIERIYSQIEGAARKSTAVTLHKYCPSFDTKFAKEAGLV